MKDNKGQALIEFILIIPVLMFIVLALFDTGSIVTSKQKLEDQMSTIVTLYENNNLSDINSFVSLNNLTINYKNFNNYTTITISKNISIITPGLNNIIGKKFKIETSRTLLNE